MPASPFVKRMASAPVVAAIAAATLTLTACGRDAPANPSSAHPPAAVSVITATPEAIEVSFEYPARLHGAREVEIRPRVSGILLKRKYEEGARVKAGQSLFQIDPVPSETAVARAEADLAAASARLEQARREAERLKPLVAAKATPQRDYDDAVSSQEVAAADVLAARARLKSARLDLKYTRVESPIDGVTSRALQPEGTLLTGPESLLAVVTQTDPIQVRFGLPDSDRARIDGDIASGRLKLPDDGRFRVRVLGPAHPNLKTTGSLDFTDVRIDPATGSSEAQADLPNPERQLRPGEFVRVRLEGAVRPDAIAVPQRAVLEGPTGRFVYVIAEGKAAVRPVTPHDWVGDRVVVDGLSAGDQVITDGVLKIGPGAPVAVTAPADTAAAKPGA
ncbi:efflux RND transporter periplasmic adaptor subunit [Denitromonas iodatirespirans]|uniref:Efflux RND transporter periplasmic adaptor subunit n=1 Tax=Denitromonas iodatirespirans TaxID=2795389 RepID=A0A944DLA9_DENI1|nr:efflux RND transporter periplasmic adaptor subunit [Denitromonas iodatirespirans]MBT0960799.1 efflux RND transporter periplasmic adaptor subunit [Denitromonas iodatirespirans]